MVRLIETLDAPNAKSVREEIPHVNDDVVAVVVVVGLYVFTSSFSVLPLSFPLVSHVHTKKFFVRNTWVLFDREGVKF